MDFFDKIYMNENRDNYNYNNKNDYDNKSINDNYDGNEILHKESLLNKIYKKN
jgi:hypothetical protein